jgi:hypothetical protein
MTTWDPEAYKKTDWYRETSARQKNRLDIPKIRFLSWPGLESVIWGLVIAHLVKWAVSFGYYAAWQVKYGTGPSGSPYFTVWDGKDLWDRLPVHVSNLLGGHWFRFQAAPSWWVVMRHDIRDVGIALIATIIVALLFSKPKYPADDNPGWKVYAARIPLAIGVALIPIGLIAILAWKLPWLIHHGMQVPAGYGVWASEANGWIAAGTWITVVMGIAGGIAARKVIQRVADDIQWFFAERSAAKVQRESALSLAGRHVIGTPAHRLRVHWLIDHAPELPARSPWLVRILLIIGAVAVIFAGAGAWLNLAGPAAPH